jgi:hypothetical protein
VSVCRACDDRAASPGSTPGLGVYCMLRGVRTLLCAWVIGMGSLGDSNGVPLQLFLNRFKACAEPCRWRGAVRDVAVEPASCRVARSLVVSPDGPCFVVRARSVRWAVRHLQPTLFTFLACLSCVSCCGACGAWRPLAPCRRYCISTRLLFIAPPPPWLTACRVQEHRKSQITGPVTV